MALYHGNAECQTLMWTVCDGQGKSHPKRDRDMSPAFSVSEERVFLNLQDARKRRVGQGAKGEARREEALDMAIM